MELRRLRLRLRRRFRVAKKQSQDIGKTLEVGTEQYIFKRFDRLRQIQRFVFVWTTLVVLLVALVIVQTFSLTQYYQKPAFVPGGIYNEGLQGSFTNANPIYATTEADVTVSRLVFAGLLKYDGLGNLVEDLASSYSVDAKGTTYTVVLRPNLRWHDGQPITSRDVVFTFNAIQNPDSRSPLLVGWQGVTVTAVDAVTVTFKLPTALASFPTNLTTGIVPEHVLGKIAAPDLRSAEFNTTRPIGAGPFQWQDIAITNDGKEKGVHQKVGLTAFGGYHAGAPRLQKFVVHVFSNETQAVQAFQKGELTGLAGFSELPKGTQGNDVHEYSLPLRAATMVFFKTNAGVLSDKTVRQSLVRAVDVQKVVSRLGYPVRQVQEPILAGQIGYDKTLAQYAYDSQKAQADLTAAGWVLGKNGVRVKDKQTLSFTVTASDTRDARRIGPALIGYWRAVGVDARIDYASPGEFQNAVTYHNYDALLNGVAIGSDPDVFAYWDSSQADIRATHRLNFSEYSSAAADASLEAGRTRIDPTLRAIKYKAFLAAWQQDAPALALYQPRSLYITRTVVDGLSESPINTTADRLANAAQWQIRQSRVTR